MDEAVAETDLAYVWVDMETTGLDAAVDVPLEVAVGVSDRWGSLIDVASWLVQENTDHYRDAIERGRKDEFVGPMHTKSGLWRDLMNDTAASFTRAEADYAICNWLLGLADPAELRTLPMAGSSIGSLDRPFTLLHFPLFNKTISYRNVDVSSIKEVCRRLNPGLFANIHAELPGDEAKDHRAEADIDFSILEYRSYVDNFLWTEEG